MAHIRYFSLAAAVSRVRASAPARLVRAFVPARTVRAFINDRRGVIAVLLGLMFPVLLGFAGLGVEVGSWYQNKRDIQISADAAAIAGVYDLKDSGTTTTITTAATAEATRNGYDSTLGNIDVIYPPTSGDYLDDESAVEVTITQTKNLSLAQIFLSSVSTIDIVSRAVATTESSGDEACVLALSTSASSAISVSGSASVELEGCHVTSNSTSSSSININGARASLEADCANSAGGIDNAVTVTACDAPSEYGKSADDPFSTLSVPGISGCDYDSANPPTTNGIINPEDFGVGNDTIVFCNGLTVNASDTLSFEPGIYIFNGGTFKINGNANVTGTGVTFIFTGDADANVAGGGTVSLSAPTSSGTWQGILFYQDPSTTQSASNDLTFSGNSDTELTGAIYVPNNSVSFSGGNDLDDNGCLVIVAQTVSFTGNADFENNCDGILPNPVYTSYTIRLVE